MIMSEDAKKEFNGLIKKYRKVVIWGLRSKYHTHRYIHAGFFRCLKKLGVSVIWTDYDLNKQQLIAAGDLVISSEIKGKFIDNCNLPVKPGVDYCLHNFDVNVLDKIDPRRLLKLQVFTSAAEQADQRWDEVTFFDSASRTLFQPWGTDLLPEEFRPATYNRHGRVFWVGSIWDNEQNQGNMAAIAELKSALEGHRLKFTPMRFVPDWLNILLVRWSRLAPAVAGRWQAENNYLPCRMFKNISYGQLGFSNVKKFDVLFRGAAIEGSTIAELVDKALSLSKFEYLNVIVRQQQVAKRHSYVNKLINICKALELVSE